jgi:hypothetical protein
LQMDAFKAPCKCVGSSKRGLCTGRYHRAVSELRRARLTSVCTNSSAMTLCVFGSVSSAIRRTILVRGLPLGLPLTPGRKRVCTLARLSFWKRPEPPDSRLLPGRLMAPLPLRRFQISHRQLDIAAHLVARWLMHPVRTVGELIFHEQNAFGVVRFRTSCKATSAPPNCRSSLAARRSRMASSAGKSSIRIERSLELIVATISAPFCAKVCASARRWARRFSASIRLSSGQSVSSRVCLPAIKDWNPATRA